MKRSELMGSLSAGLGAFLARVDVEAVKGSDHRFHGWRILALHGGADAWGGVDLKAMDVVVGVNGMPIEHPEQAMACWQSLAVSPELRVSFERSGQPHELRIPIDDDGAASKTSRP